MNNNTNHNFSQIKLDYFPDLSGQLFAPVAHLPWAMLLNSASENHPDSRFDILVANPVVTLETSGFETIVTQADNTVIHQEEPFTLLEKYLETTLPTIEPINDTPFVGGALGYFSYDLGRSVEKLPELATRDIDIPDMVIGIYEWAVIVDHHKKSARVVGIHAEQHYQWLIQQKTVTEQSLFALKSGWTSNMTALSYGEKFNAIQEYLLSGDCYQINLAQRFAATYQGSEWQAYQRLLEQNSAPFSAFIRTNDAYILSVSPERLLQLRGDKVETKPIKGTRPRSSNPVTDNQNAENLKSAEKDQAENLMIVDLLRNDIGRVAKPGTVSVPKLFEIESFPSVHHLVSTVTAELDTQYSATDLLRACFPGGSITGAPKVRAMEIIEELEPHRRSTYCGSIGYISRCGTMDTSITIRTLIAHKNKIYAWAGGGIVADSECDAEYQETFDKLSKILPVLERDE